MQNPESQNERPLYDVGDPRIYFVAERTLLAWIRTGVAMMGFGFVVARFGLFLRELALTGAGIATPHLNAPYVGIGMVFLGVIVNAAATLRYWKAVRALTRNEPIVPEIALPSAVALGAAFVGVVLV